MVVVVVGGWWLVVGEWRVAATGCHVGDGM